MLPKQFFRTLLAAQPHVSNLLPLLPARGISGGDANNMDELSFQNHASLPTDTVRPCEGKSFLLSYENFPFKECCVIPSPRDGWLLQVRSPQATAKQFHLSALLAGHRGTVSLLLHLPRRKSQGIPLSPYHYSPLPHQLLWRCS